MQNRSISYLSGFLTILITLLGLIYTQDLSQKNKESIFLTQVGQKHHFKFQDEFAEKNIIIIKKDYKYNTSDKDLREYNEQINLIQTTYAEDIEVLSHIALPEEFNDLFSLKSANYLGSIIITEPHVKFKKIYDTISNNSFWGEIGKDFHIAGSPYTNYLLDEYSRDIKNFLFPMLFVAIFTFLFLLTRSPIHSLVLFIPCLAITSLTLIATKILFTHSNLIIAILPLLMFIINLSLVLHLYYTAKALGGFKLAIKAKLQPTILMVSTTFIGFFSLYFSELEVIQNFGVLAAVLLVFGALITLNWFYHIESTLELKFEKREFQVDPATTLYRLFSKFYSGRFIFTLALISVVAGTLLFFKVPVITDATKYFPKSSGLKQSIDNVTENIVGMPILEVVIEQKEKLTIENLASIYNLERELIARLNNRSKKYTLLTLNQLVARGNKSYTGELQLPSQLIAYASIASKVPYSLQEGYPFDDNKYRLTILGSAIDVSEYENLIQEITSILEKSKMKYSLNGLYYHLMTAQKQMIYTLLKSFLASLVVISTIALIYFRRINVFFIFLFVNIIPVTMSFILMYLLGLSFNIATVMTYSISLGIIVDSSFHIIHTLQKPELTRDYFYKTICLPVISSSLLLAICFSSFSLNDFLPIKQFGICLALILVIGMIFDLKILPSLYLKKTKIEN